MKRSKPQRQHPRSITVGLRAQLILYISAFSLVVLILGSLLTYRNVMDMLEKRNAQLVVQQFNQIEHNLSRLFEEVDRLSNFFLMDDTVQSFLQKSHTSFVYEDVDAVKKIHNRIKGIIMNYPFVDSVYLFTAENQEAVGASEQNGLIVRKGDRVHPFFASEAYRNATTRDAPKIWSGGYERKYFNEAIAQRDADSHVISLIKRVKAIADPRWGGVIAFNIKQEYISSIYNSLKPHEGSIYILDESGIVISGGDESEIGAASPLFGQLDRQRGFGSVSLQQGRMSTQLVYYKIETFNWYLMREIPLHLESSDTVPLKRTFVIVCGASIAAMLAASFFWIRRLMRPLNVLTRKMLDMGRGKLGLTVSNIPHNELGIVIRQFNEMSVSMVELVHKIEQIEKQKRDLEIGALQAQINPHFLYNSLTLIKWMAAAANANNVVDSISSLGKLLRPVFNSTASMWTVQEEREYLSSYMSIMNLRFSNRIAFAFETDERLLAYLLPRFILQPVVENAIGHGMRAGRGQLRVEVRMEERDGDLRIAIADSGPGIAAETLDKIRRSLTAEEAAPLRPEERGSGSGSGIGIVNVARRIRLTYGERYGLQLSCPATGGTEVLIRIPKVKE